MNSIFASLLLNSLQSDALLCTQAPGTGHTCGTAEHEVQVGALTLFTLCR